MPFPQHVVMDTNQTSLHEGGRDGQHICAVSMPRIVIKEWSLLTSECSLGGNSGQCWAHSGSWKQAAPFYRCLF